MNVDSILLSEYASTYPDGRLTVVNAFNRLSGPGPKWGLPVMYLTLVVHGPLQEAGTEHEGEIKLLNAQRELINKEPMKFMFRFPPNDGNLTPGMPVRSITTVALGLQFDAPGPYAFEITIDGYFAAATLLHVTQVDKQASS